MHKRYVSVLFAFLMLFLSMNMPTLATGTVFLSNVEEATDLSTVIGTAAQTISTDGAYSISKVDVTNGVTVAADVTATLYLTDVNITTTGASPILVKSGAVLHLVVSGTNTLTAPINFAAVSVQADSVSAFGEVKISGDGILNAIGGNFGAGIGGDKFDTSLNTGVVGKITIDGSTVVAQGGNAAAGIGGGQNCSSVAAIIVNDGHVAATGGMLAPGIGGSYQCDVKQMEFHGGYTVATKGASFTKNYSIGPGHTSTSVTPALVEGGSINGNFNVSPLDKEGHKTYQIILTMPGGSDMADKTVEMNGFTAITDSEGKLYIYECDKADFSLKYDGKIYYVEEDVTFTDGATYTLKEYDGAACSCAQETSDFTLLDWSESISINILQGKTRKKLEVVYEPTSGCTHPMHSVSAEYSLAVEGMEDVSSVAALDGNYLEVYYAGAGSTLTLHATVTMGEFTYEKAFVATLVADNSSRFDISKGGIAVTAGADADTLQVTHGSDKYNVAASGDIYIFQSDALSTTNVISVIGTDARIVIDNLHIKTITNSILTLGQAEAVNVTLELVGENIFEATNTAVISGYTGGSTLTIEGDGSLSSTSGTGAGIGNINRLTVNSGTVIATGGDGGAGIGGGKDGAAKNVIINGGRVYAYGSEGTYAAGIGGGESTTAGSGGNIVINGGFVQAESGVSAGYGIGPGGNTYEPGTVTVNGGSVKASLITSTRPANSTGNQYLLTLQPEDIFIQKDVQYSVGEDPAEKIPTSTDSTGRLYLYLNAGRQWVRVYDGETVYYRYIDIATNDRNAGTAVIDAACELTDMHIAGQIGATKINEATQEVRITVPYNIDLSYVTPVAEYTAAFSQETGRPINFSENRTATFTIVGHDAQTKQYTITLEVASEPEQIAETVFDIADGSIVITETYVRYGGTRYNRNDLGYVITGTTTVNTVSLDWSGTEAALPPITFWSLQIDLPSEAFPLNVHTSADIRIEEQCVLRVAEGPAIRIDNNYGFTDGANLNFTAVNADDGTKDRLTIETKKISEPPGTVSIQYGASVTVAGVTTYILAPEGENALVGGGSFYTDSNTFLQVSQDGSTTAIQPKTASGVSLFQMRAIIDSANTTDTSCIYNDKKFYVGTDATLYLMMPNGTHGMSATYMENEYQARPVVDNAAVTCHLQIVKVTGVTYDTAAITYPEQTVGFTVEGENVIGNVLVRLVPDTSSRDTLEQIVGEGGRVVFTIPENESHDTAVTYTVYVVVKDPVAQDVNLVQLWNNTACDITAFEIEGQISSSITESEALGNIITVNMPYDHTFKQRYTANVITHKGDRVSPGVDSEQLYEASGSYVYYRHYTVTAKDNETTKNYEVRIYKETTPSIMALSFTNPSTAAGGTVTVKARGTALGNIARAENKANRDVYIYSDDGIAPVKATPVVENGVVVYVADITVPENTSDTESAYHVLRAKINDRVQTGINDSLATVTVPRRKREVTDIKAFTVENQVGESIISNANGTVQITMPYDAPLTGILPSVILEDLYAGYAPVDAQDFEDAEGNPTPVTFTVTSENGEASKQFTVTLTRQETPYATSVSFTDPEFSSAGRIPITISGEYLDNAAHAVTQAGAITVSLTLIGAEEPDAGEEGGTETPGGDEGETGGTEGEEGEIPGEGEEGEIPGEGGEISGEGGEEEEPEEKPDTSVASVQAVSNGDGTYTAIVVVPSNTTLEAREYTISVTIGNVVQNLEGDVILTVPPREADSKELTDIILVEGQSDIYWSTEPNTLYLYVPYNTDLRAVTPTVYHTGVSYFPTDPQNFSDPNTPVQYTVSAQDGTSNTYRVSVYRSVAPKINNIVIDQPTTFNDLEVAVAIDGDFVGKEPVGDVMRVWAEPVAGGDPIEAVVTYDEAAYGGKATATFTLPAENDAPQPVSFTIRITINGLEKDWGLNKTITLPGRKARTITSFAVHNQVGSTAITEVDENGGTILFAMPYAADLTALTPVISINGDDYSPKTAQNFELGNTVTFTVSADRDTDRTYTATAIRDGMPTISTVTFERPETFDDKTIDLQITGTFFYSLVVRAVPEGGGEPITATANLNGLWHTANVTLTLPTNESFMDEAVYTLEFDIDGFENIENPSNGRIVIPRRKTREIRSFIVNNQFGTARIDHTKNEVHAQVVYDTDLATLQPTLVIDGDSFAPTGVVDFDNETKSVEYKISAADDVDRTYTVYITRNGTPSIKSATFVSPPNFNGGGVTVHIEGVFFENAEVSAVADDGSGTTIIGKITSFEDRTAEALLQFPTNESFEEEKTYTLQFVMDGFITAYIGSKQITVPRRTTREITAFNLPEDIQEGETTIEGTDIYVGVPYHLDITSVVPTMTFDAHRISPLATDALDFSNPASPVQYTLSSSGDEDVTYVVRVTRMGKDPKLLSLTIADQVLPTEYSGNNIYVSMDDRADLSAIEPVLAYEGTTDYWPRGPQNFTDSWETPLEYTLTNQYGITTTYYVKVERTGSGAKATYLVSFNTNSSSVINSVSVRKNYTVPRPVNPVREGYTFGGWFTESSLRNLYDFSTPVMANLTLHAKWTKNAAEEKPGSDDKKNNGGSTGSETKPDGSQNAGSTGTSGTGSSGSTPGTSGTAGTGTTPGTSVTPGVPDEKLLFTDVSESDWFYDAVQFVAEQKICNGTSTTTFAPHMQITRGMLATVLYRSEGGPEVSGTCSFTDVESGAYYEKAIIWAQNNGIVKGYSDTLFGPDDPVKREQIAAMLYRFAAFLGRDTASEEADIQGYADYDSISAYAVTPLCWTAGSGIMIGKTATTINPQDYATRAELAVILQRFIEGNS